jgi:hypothetical protein
MAVLDDIAILLSFYFSLYLQPTEEYFSQLFFLGLYATSPGRLAGTNRCLNPIGRIPWDSGAAINGYWRARAQGTPQATIGHSPVPFSFSIPELRAQASSFLDWYMGLFW